VRKGPLEIVNDGDDAIAYFIDPKWEPNQTTFLTPDHFGQQMGMIVYSAGEHIIPHQHLPVTRKVEGTTECILVKKGKCYIDIYNKKKDLIFTKEMCEGEIVLLLGGAHGFRMIEDTILFEVKQGPYVGEDDKKRFDEKDYKV
tara:strand:- start:168 stop:596 length:429 start_codon:yes stop_codon:yes gene_type:complete